MTASYSDSALWLKAKLFINHAMDSDELRTFDERALWASLALELLAKAALARVSPLLIATPSDEGTSFLIASGLVQGDGRLNTIRAHTLYSRCTKAFRPFNEKDANAITWARNEYLHGGSATFTTIPEEAWWPRYWAQAIILVNAQDRTLEEFVGSSRVPLVEDYLAQNKKNVEHRAEMLIERAKQRFLQNQEGNLPARIATQYASPTDLTAGLSHHADETCPACGSMGTVEGDEVEAHEIQTEQVSDFDYDTWVDLTVVSSYFSCSACRLVLDNADLIQTAGLDDFFTATGDVEDYFEPDYGND